MNGIDPGVSTPVSGLTALLLRQEDGFWIHRSSERRIPDRARVCPEGLGPGIWGNPCSTPWTDLADTIRPSGTSDHPERGNPNQMKRFRPTDLVIQGISCEKDGVTRTRKQGPSRKMIQVIGDIPVKETRATWWNSRDIRSRSHLRVAIVEGIGSNRNLKRSMDGDRQRSDASPVWNSGQLGSLTLVDPPGRLTSPTGSQSCILGNPDHRKRPSYGRHPHIGSLRVKRSRATRTFSMDLFDG